MSIPDGSTTLSTLGFITAKFPWETDIPGVEVVSSSRPTNSHNSGALSSTASTRTGNNQSPSGSISNSSSVIATPNSTSLSTLSGSASLTNASASTVIQSTSSATAHDGSKNRILPIAVTIPIFLFSIILIALNMFRRRQRLHAMLLPHITSDADDQRLIQDVRDGRGSSPRYQIMEPFRISRMVPKGKVFRDTKPKPKRLVFDTTCQATEGIATNDVEGLTRLTPGPGAPPIEQNDPRLGRTEEIINPSNPRRRSSLLEQVEALQERLRVMEDTMDLERGLREVIPPPEYTPTPDMG